MVNGKISKKLNKQLNLELSAEYAYLGMAAWCETNDWPGFTLWFKGQAEEEREHAMKIYQYILDQGQAVELQDIKAEKASYSSLLEVMKSALKHEQKVSKSYYEFIEIVRKEKDYATEIFLSWFVTEQVEEEALIGSLVEKLKRAGKNVEALLILDNEAKTSRDNLD